MRPVVLLILIALSESKNKQISFPQIYLGSVHEGQCIANQQAISIFRNAFDAFTANLLKKVTLRGNKFAALSPHSAWITLAAIAEGTDENTQKVLFSLLNLPKNACSRQKLYQVATTRIFPTKYVNLYNNRIIVMDESSHINPNWHNSVRQHSLLQIVSAPIKHDPVTTLEIIKYYVLTNQMLNFNGYSLLLNSMDYDGLWTNAFSDAVVEHAPFYSQAGQQIGSVDLMKIRKNVRIGYVASTNSKVLELPIGPNEEYRMIFALVVDNDPNIEPMVSNFNNYTMFEIIASLHDSYLPIDVAIPRFMMKSEIDMKRVLEDMGVVDLWQDPGATGYVSSPPAMPTSYIQRTTVTLKSEGIHKPPLKSPPFQHLNDEERYWGEFVANRPFMFALVDAQTYTYLMVAMYTEPTYSS